MIGTARANPGKDVSHPGAPGRSRARPRRCRRVYDGAALAGRRRPDLDRRRRHAEDGQQVQALPGAACPRAATRIPVVHLPKTIDNDYMGIDFTFGYFTAVEIAGQRDPQPAGRRRGEPQLLPRRDDGPQRRLAGLRCGHRRRGQPGDQRRRHRRQVPRRAKKSSIRRPARQTTRRVMDVDEVVKRIVATMRAREEAEGKEFGVIVLAEGLAEFLPDELPGGRPARRARAHRHLASSTSAGMFAELVAEEYTAQDRPASARSPACNSATKPAAPSRTPST